MSKTIYITNQNFGDYIDTYIDITHSELLTLKNNGNLITNQKYRITDFKTIYIIDNGMERVLSNSNEGINYGIDSPYEPLIIRAATESSFYKTVVSQDYPTDLIEYEFEYELLLPPIGYGEPTPVVNTGRIISRTDTINNITCDFDFRNIYVSLHKIDNTLIPTYGSSFYDSQMYKTPNTTDGVNVTVEYRKLKSYSFESTNYTTIVYIDSESKVATYANMYLANEFSIDQRMSDAKFAKTFTYFNTVDYYEAELSYFKNINIKGVGNVIIIDLRKTAGFYHDINIETSYNFLSGDIFDLNLLALEQPDGYIAVSESERYFGGNNLYNVNSSTLKGSKSLLNILSNNEINTYGSYLFNVSNSKIKFSIYNLCRYNYTSINNLNANLITYSFLYNSITNVEANSIIRTKIENLADSSIINIEESALGNVSRSIINNMNSSKISTCVGTTFNEFINYSHIKITLAYCTVNVPIIHVFFGNLNTVLNYSVIRTYYFYNFNDPSTNRSLTKYWYSTFDASGNEIKTLIPTTGF